MQMQLKQERCVASSTTNKQSLAGIFAAVTCSMMAAGALAQAGETVSMTNSDNSKTNIYVSGPADAKAGVLIVHDWFGLTDFTKESADRLGKDGYRVIAVDLYDGQSATTHEQAKVLSTDLDRGKAQTVIQEALKQLNSNQRATAVVGYSLGAAIVLRAAAENPEDVRAAAVIYGGSFDKVSDESLATIGPVLTITGSADTWSYPEQITLEKRMHGMGRPLEAYVYPGADHAFAQPFYNGGDTYDPMATLAMRNVLDGFLERHLGSAM